MAKKKQPKRSTAARSQKGAQESLEYAMQTFEKLEDRSPSILAKEVASIAGGLKKDADAWGKIDVGDLDGLAKAMLDIALTHYQLWLVGEKLRTVQAKAVHAGTVSALDQTGFSREALASLSLSISSRHLLGSRRFLFIQGKVAAVVNILSEQRRTQPLRHDN